MTIWHEQWRNEAAHVMIGLLVINHFHAGSLGIINSVRCTKGLTHNLWLEWDIGLNSLVQRDSLLRKESVTHTVNPVLLGSIWTAPEALCHPTLSYPPMQAAQSSATRLTVIGKLLKGTWAHWLSSAEAAGLSESCKEQRCRINASEQGLGPSQAAPLSTFRWTWCHSQWSTVIRCPFIT